jgi:hypothetical protein
LAEERLDAYLRLSARGPLDSVLYSSYPFRGEGSSRDGLR